MFPYPQLTKVLSKGEMIAVEVSGMMVGKSERTIEYVSEDNTS